MNLRDLSTFKPSMTPGSVQRAPKPSETLDAAAREAGRKRIEDYVKTHPPGRDSKLTVQKVDKPAFESEIKDLCSAQDNKALSDLAQQTAHLSEVAHDILSEFAGIEAITRGESRMSPEAAELGNKIRDLQARLKEAVKSGDFAEVKEINQELKQVCKQIVAYVESMGLKSPKLDQLR